MPKVPTTSFDKSGDWQHFCTELLHEALRLPEHQRAQAWSEARKILMKLAKEHIVDPKHRRIIIADVDLRNQHLQDFDFSYCYIVRTNFKSADLRNSKFSYAMIRGGSLNDANTNGTNFQHADIDGTSVETLQYNPDTRLNFARFKPAGPVPQQLQDRVDQDRIIASNRNAPPFNKLLNLITGYGFGIGRLLLVSIVLVIVFGVAYWLIDRHAYAIGAGSIDPQGLTLWNFLFLSIERFLNASPWIYGVSALTHFITVLENVVGLFMLAILLAMLVRRVVRSG